MGTILGFILGYAIAAIVISPTGMMSTYFDLPDWALVMPPFCIPVVILTNVFLTLISYLSVKRMLKGTAADALRPYAPKAMKKSILEKLPFWEKLPFGTKWNVRDILRHKSRSTMTLIGVVGCMLLLVGGLGMKDTMDRFMVMLDEEVNHYTTKINLSEAADNNEIKALAERVEGDWLASSGISYKGETVTLEIYKADNNKIRFLNKENELMKLSDDGVYLCLRLADTATIGDVIEISPYGSEETYEVKVAGYLRSLMTESIVMTEDYADSIGMKYRVMSYVERHRELATLKVLGFRDKHITRLLISQNIWLTVTGVLIGLPAGVGVLYILVTSLVSEYELSLTIGALTYIVSILLTFGVSLIVGWMVAGKNKKIDMVEALKGAE